VKNLSFEIRTMTPQPMYPPEAVQPMRDELTALGFEELMTAAEVEQAVNSTGGTMLGVINSVCGCAAGSARPGVGLALQHRVIPDRFVTVFAGMERDAVDRLRSYHAGLAAPSSPSFVLFKAGKIVRVIERHEIQGREPKDIAAILIALFDQLCSRPGPSIPPEVFARLPFVQACGSNLPRLAP
jgi:putative YphP/YqiW family bacilliredoxin